MASSVSSERTFSSTGITISKHCNRLKGDVVEALQCLKCMIHNNLIFRFDPTMPIIDEITEEDDTPTDTGDNMEPDGTTNTPSTSLGDWYDILLDLDDTDDTEG